ncbi:MAG: molybdate ABC transporter substrate-binding protein [Actinomycetota bacterium]
MSRWVVAGCAALMATAGCGGEDEGGDGAGLSGTVTVLAASSLTEAFEQLGGGFEAEHPAVDVEFSFAASSELVVQIQQGAPVDVFASADESNMEKVVDSGDVTARPAIFTRNRLAIAVEEDNPRDIRGLEDLDEPGLVVVLCAQQVPCGKFAHEALAKAGVSVTPASRAENVKAALTPVALGEADAAIVYVTDVQASTDVEGVEIPDDQNVIAAYPIAPLAEAENNQVAQAFVRFVRSTEGQRVLRDFGFLPP